MRTGGPPPNSAKKMLVPFILAVSALRGFGSEGVAGKISQGRGSASLPGCAKDEGIRADALKAAHPFATSLRESLNLCVWDICVGAAHRPASSADLKMLNYPMAK